MQNQHILKIFCRVCIFPQGALFFSKKVEYIFCSVCIFPQFFNAKNSYAVCHFPTGAFCWEKKAFSGKFWYWKKSISIVTKMIERLQMQIRIICCLLTPIYHSYCKTICFPVEQTLCSFRKENIHMKIWSKSLPKIAHIWQLNIS